MKQTLIHETECDRDGCGVVTREHFTDSNTNHYPEGWVLVAKGDTFWRLAFCGWACAGLYCTDLAKLKPAAARGGADR
jgi:hypothetical protein